MEADLDNLDAIVRTQRAEIERLRFELDNARENEASWKKYAESYAQAAIDIRETLRKAATASLKPETCHEIGVRIEGQR